MKRVATTMEYGTGLVVAALLGLVSPGCARERAAPVRPAAAEPSAAPSATAPTSAEASQDKPTVTEQCAYHPNEGIASLAKTLPAGSVDTLDLYDQMDGLMLVVVEVTVAPRPQSAPSKFTTTFRLPTGVEVKKPWQGASGNASGFFRAVLTVPIDAKCVATATSS
jgi:hypothetical protein